MEVGTVPPANVCLDLVGDMHSPKGRYNTSIVPAAMASCIFQITIQESLSHIQITEWNSATVSKRFDPKVY